MKTITSSLFLIFFFAGLCGGQEKILNSDGTHTLIESPWKFADIKSKASLRGLHVYSPQYIWASGTGGTIINTIDGGKTWNERVVKGAEELDFRDIHAIDDGTIVAITSGTPARIYRSTTSGASWQLCYESKDERVFLDSVSFLDSRRGIVMGDPIGDGLYLLATKNGGMSWNAFKQVPRVLPGEAGFAASGTNMTSVGSKRIYIGLGSHEKDKSSRTSRVIFSTDTARTWKKAEVPIARSQSAGIFSLCFADSKYGVAVGGDYEKPDETTSNFAVTRDGGRSWSTPTPREPPSGFRSCVAIWKKGQEVNMIAVGPNGTDRSPDMGNKWHRISNEGFHAIDFDNKGRIGWACGSDGRIAQWQGLVPAKLKASGSMAGNKSKSVLEGGSRVGR